MPKHIHTICAAETQDGHLARDKQLPVGHPSCTFLLPRSTVICAPSERVGVLLRQLGALHVSILLRLLGSPNINPVPAYYIPCIQPPLTKPSVALHHHPQLHYSDWIGGPKRRVIPAIKTNNRIVRYKEKDINYLCVAKYRVGKSKK